MSVVRVLGRINTAILLTIVYFAILPFFHLFAIYQNKKRKSSGSSWKIKQPNNANSHEFQF